MYYLMNKDRMILAFRSDWRSDLDGDVSFIPAAQPEHDRMLPFGYDSSITAWIENRKGSKHSAHLRRVMERLGCADHEGFIRLTHAAGINDTFWIKSDSETISWNDVSLFRNQFSEAVSRLAFEGTGIGGNSFSSTSPELSCEGSFRKCFRKERKAGQFGSDIFLCKRGSEAGDGLEPYCEVLASEIAGIVSPSAVRYELLWLHGRLASGCNVFTNEKTGYASFSKIRRGRGYSFQDAVRFFENIGCEQEFREMLVIDSLCFNQDRHAGNYGVLYDNDTMEIVGAAPVFDLNLALLPYVRITDLAQIGDVLYERAPKLGSDFTEIGQIAVNDVIRDRLKDIADFSFSFRGDDLFPEKRVRILEETVRRQAKAILSGEKLRTRDVFFSQKAAEEEQRFQQEEAAAVLMDRFADRIDECRFLSDGLVSVCSAGAVQFYYEFESYLLTADFLSGRFAVTQNAQPISMKELKKAEPDYYRDVKMIEKELHIFMKEEKCRIFAKHFQSMERETV